MVAIAHNNYFIAYELIAADERYGIGPVYLPPVLAKSNSLLTVKQKFRRMNTILILFSGCF